MDLPLGLTQAIQSGRCVLMLGAGVGYNCHRPDGSHMPDAPTLARALAEHFSLDEVSLEPDPLNLAQVAELIALLRDRTALERITEQMVDGFSADNDLQWLITRPWRAIYTTNYDSSIEHAFNASADLLRSPVHVSVTSSIRSVDPAVDIPVYYLHGKSGDGPKGARLVLSESDYTKYSDRRRGLFQLFQLSFATDTLLYVGYGNLDEDWRQITQDMRQEFAPSVPPVSFRVAPTTSAISRQVLASQGITTVDGGTTDLVAALREANIDWHAASERTPNQNNIPKDLAPLAEKNPGALHRLLENWQYVNDAEFNAPPNSRAFLRGDLPNWSLVGSGIGFERDIESPTVETLLDFAVDTGAKTRNHIVLGSAGAGTTTCLMQIAAWLAKASATSILWLREGMTFHPADVEYAVASLTRPIFFIDNAADVAADVWIAFERARTLNRPFSLVMGSRLSEWREARPRIGGNEVALEALSDSEIPRVIECLRKAGELGVLASLDPELRVARIKRDFQKELLVLLRESTEGRAFDAIIESEYEGLASDLSRHVYALVSCFYRLGALLRVSLLARLLGMSIPAVYEELTRMDGVVRFEPGGHGGEGLRTRHHVIAELVWQRCASTIERERMQLDAIGNLNLNFELDTKAFQAFTRIATAVDSIAGLEGKTKFFEAAIRKDPDNSFVRQHYARMLRREKLFETALSQINTALETSPRVQALHHTKAVILKDMALAADTLTLGRRYLAQSEAELLQVISVNGKDEYGYATLAELYLGWAERDDDESNSLSYATKAQETVQTGLAMARRRESLYIVASKLERFAGDEPRRVEALRQACLENPEGVQAPQMLGRLLMQSGDLDGAEAVLRPAISRAPTNPSLVTVFALTRERQGATYDECVAIMSSATLEGLSDARYTATFGGMLCMAGHTGESEALFERAERLNFSIREKQMKSYWPLPANVSPQLEGRVININAGFAFLQVADKPIFS